MTPPSTAVARSHPGRAVRTVAPRTARRVSGAARTPSHEPVRPSQGAALAPPLGLALARRAAALPDARLLDRLARGRLWIALLAVGLFGVVFLQISLLKLNTGISRGVQTVQTLERQNTELRFDLSRLGGGERVQDSAAAMGFVVPVMGQPKFLDAAGVSAARAAANVAPPAPIQQLPLGMIPPAVGGTADVTPDPTSTLGAEPAAAGTAVGAAPLGSGAAAGPDGATVAADGAAPTASTSATPAPVAPAGATHAASAPAGTAHATAPVTAPPGAASSRAGATGGATATAGG